MARRKNTRYKGYVPGLNAKGFAPTDAYPEDGVTNAIYSATDQFKAACKRAGEMLGTEIKVTTRQAAKYRNKSGIVYRTLVGNMSEQEMKQFIPKFEVKATVSNTDTLSEALAS